MPTATAASSIIVVGTAAVKPSPKATGSQSGEERSTPLIYRERDGDHVLVASNGGSVRHPSWFSNLEANPEAEIQVMDERFKVRPRVAEGEERDQLWALMNEQWPAYDSYQERADRQIPVVVLERV